MPYRILVVDDDPLVREMLRLLLRTRPDWEFAGEAGNGQDAVQKAKEQHPDLILMDMAMPLQDGISASREISAALPGVAILMHTLHCSKELELEAKKAGIRKIVAKTETSEVLLRTIEDLLAQSPASPSVKISTGSEGPIQIPAVEPADSAQLPQLNGKTDSSAE